MHYSSFNYPCRLRSIINLCNLLSLILFSSVLLYSGKPYADDVEYKVKAGYLYNFTKFITWPDDKSSSFNICILGADPFGDLLSPIEQRPAFGKPIKLFRLENTTALIRISKSTLCHIIFVSASLEIPSVLQNSKNVLIVGDAENFALNGGMIGFITQDSRIKLQINRQIFLRSELKVSAKLFEVSDVIEGLRHD